MTRNRPSHRSTHRRRALQWAVALAAGSAALWRSSSASAGEAIALTPQRALNWHDYLGINAQFQIFSRAQTARQIEALKALGLEWVRLGIHWMVAEPEREHWQLGEYDRVMAQVAAAKLHSITAVVGTPRFASSVPAQPSESLPAEFLKYFDKFPPRDPVLFASRMAMLAQRYPMVDVWQVWNEPNIPGFWLPQADPEGYVKLLAPAVLALRQAAPGHGIALAGMAYLSQMPHRKDLMLQALGQLGVFQHGLIAAYHPYTAEAEGDAGGARNLTTLVQALNGSLRAAGVKQIWATEWGWSSYSGPQEEQPIVGEQGQADLTLRRLALMAALDFDRIFLFALSDMDDPRVSLRDRSYGLLRADGSPKPLYTALTRFLQTTGAGLHPGTAPLEAKQMPRGLVSIGWRRGDGKRLWMVWADRAQELRLPGVTRAQLSCPLDGSSRDLADAQGVVVPVRTALQLLVY